MTLHRLMDIITHHMTGINMDTAIYIMRFM